MYKAIVLLHEGYFCVGYFVRGYGEELFCMARVWVSFSANPSPVTVTRIDANLGRKETHNVLRTLRSEGSQPRQDENNSLPLARAWPITTRYRL